MVVVLDQINYWVAVTGTAVDVLLLARVLQLRLPRTYLYVTLFCLVGVFFDGVQLWFGLHSDTTARISLYSRFLYAFLYPLAAWDAVEEMKGPVLQIRRVLLARLISAMLLAAVFGFIVSLFLTSDDTNESFLSTALALVLWAGSSAATLGFLWSLQKMLKAQQITRPHNTVVWMTFFQLTLLAEIASCFGSVAGSFANATVQTSIEIVLTLYVTVITIWCITKLKKVESDIATEASSSAS